MSSITTLDELIALAIALGAPLVPGWSEQEESRALLLPGIPSSIINQARNAIRTGADPLGDIYCRLVSSEQRRPHGAVYTPSAIVSAMVRWAHAQAIPDRVIDPGTGSGRFLVAAGRTFKRSSLFGIENDPVAAILARGHIAAAGLADRTRILVSDYRDCSVQQIDGRTLFIGNPPYVRHHLIGSSWKQWLLNSAQHFGYSASGLAGLHVYFFLATATFAKEGDYGTFITSAEWLDVNYGSLVRNLFLGPLGGLNLQLIEPTALPFPGTATTGVITGFSVGSAPKTIGIRRVESLQDLGSLETDREIRRTRLADTHRWTSLTRIPIERRADFVELGELCRVHRGQVTGANKVWITGDRGVDLPEIVLFPSITKARELFRTEGILDDVSRLRKVIDIPMDLDALDNEARHCIERYLKYAKSQGADRGYVASHRKAWWSVGLRSPAPILATYMARRPPVFVRNRADARHINIAHGLYPRETLSETVLHNLAIFLSSSVSTNNGRTYAGGLTKFEPREMERLMVPLPDVLANIRDVQELAL
ncbi:MAG: N-6 DNA methylase [Kouleothrix sp.]|nr:N-6 DNA methylase [Kouleothrix sp.]